MPSPSPAILVAYATSTGTTREIAERIASTLQTTTSWHVDCKPVSEITSLHQQLHRLPSPSSPAPTPAEETANNNTTHPAVNINPLSALIPPESELQKPVEYKAVIIGSSIHSGRWIGPGRNFVAQNAAFFAGRCCSTTDVGAKKLSSPSRCSWCPFRGRRHHEQEPPAEPGPEQTQQQEQQVTTERSPPPPPKVYAFSVGMPGNDEALASEQKTVEAALRKALGKKKVRLEEEGEEVLQNHILFRGKWSLEQLDMLAPPFIARMIKWCIPANSPWRKGDDKGDWDGIEKWAAQVGNEIVAAAA